MENQTADYAKCICCMCGKSANTIAIRTMEFICDKCLQNDIEARYRK